MAPALGLYLDELYFTQYNIKQKRDREQKLADLEVIRKRALSKQQQGQGQGHIHKHQQQKSDYTVKTEDTNTEATLLLEPTPTAAGGVVLSTEYASHSASAVSDTKRSDTAGSAAPPSAPTEEPDDSTKEGKEVEKEEVQVSKKVRIDDDGGYVASASAITAATKVGEVDEEGHNSEGEKEEGEDEIGEAEGQVSIICSAVVVLYDKL